MKYFDQNFFSTYHITFCNTNVRCLASNCIAFSLHWFVVIWSSDLVPLFVIKGFTVFHFAIFLEIFRFRFVRLFQGFLAFCKRTVRVISLLHDGNSHTESLKWERVGTAVNINKKRKETLDFHLVARLHLFHFYSPPGK